MNQIAYSLDKQTLISIGKGALIAVGGALCVYLLQILPQLNFGTLTPIVVSLASIVINAIYQYIKGQPA